MKRSTLRSLLCALFLFALVAACNESSGPDVTDDPDVTEPPPQGGDDDNDPVQAPYSGAAAVVPGLIEAENFDLGGEGLAYHDEDEGNSGGAYRLDEDVDIAVTGDADGGGYDVSDLQAGEWLSYTIDIAEAGDYNLEFRVSSEAAAGTLNVQIDGSDVTGAIAVPQTGADSYAWTGRDNVSLPAGEHTLTIQAESELSALNAIRVSRTPTAGPYLGMPFTAPGTFEAEDFDAGGEGAAYHDETAGNTGGRYRGAEDVDIFDSTDAEGGSFVVGDIESGEWLGYTIDVATTGDYDIELRVASDTGNAAFRVEIDGQDVSGVVAVPDTGGMSGFQWVGKKTIPIQAGEHELRIVADRQFFDLNSLRVQESVPATAPPEPTPFGGAPAAVPGTFEAEDFDLGGQGVAYNDIGPGNAGGAYRADEDVDIIATGDSSGGFDVNQFDTGEWLSYTIDVAESGNYDIELRVASAFPDSAFRIEVDGQDVTAAVPVPNTGNWTAFEWAVSQDVSLSAGRHVLRVIAEQQYFNLNSIRITEEAPTPEPPPPDGSATLLFNSGFEGQTSLLPPAICWGTGCWQEIIGLDSITGFSWPSTLWNGDSRFLMLTDPAPISALTIGNYMFNRVESTGGRDGSPTQVLYQEITRNHNGTEPMGTSPTQNELEFQPKQDVEDLYVSFWMKFQPDMVEKMNNLPAGPGISGGGTWRAFFAMKTGSQQSDGSPASDGDYRIEAYVMTYGGGQPYWQILGDNTAGGGAPLTNGFSVTNRDVPVPVGEWFKFEIFWHRSDGDDGRVWMAVDGQVIADRSGPNVGAWGMPVNRIMSPLLYSGGRMPVYQWIDDIEIWDGFPPQGSNPPYAAH